MAVPDHVRSCQRLIEQWMPSIKEMLPQHITPDRMLRLARSMVVNTPKLAMCTPLSLMTALAECSLLGLEPNTPLGYAWIIPFKDEAVLVPGYKGYIELMYRNPLVRGVNAGVVYSADEFDYDEGTDQFIKHKKANGDRGVLKWAYAFAKVGGERVVRVLTADEVLKHKNASKAARSGDPQCPWNNEWEYTMWQKTAILDIAKFVPKSREMSTFIEHDSRDQGFKSGSTIVEELVSDAAGNTAPRMTSSPAATQAPQETRSVQNEQAAPPAEEKPAEPARKTRNQRPGKAAKEEAPPAPQAANGDAPPDDIGSIGDVPSVPGGGDNAAQDAPPDLDEEAQKTKRLLLDQIEGFRVKIKGETTAFEIYKALGYSGPDDVEKETDLNKLQSCAEEFGRALAEEEAEARRAQPTYEAVSVARLHVVDEEVKNGKKPTGLMVSLMPNQARVSDFADVKSNGKNLMQIKLFEGAGPPAEIFLQETEKADLPWLSKSVLVNCPKITIIKHSNGRVYNMVAKGDLVGVF